MADFVDSAIFRPPSFDSRHSLTLRLTVQANSMVAADFKDGS
jgi:hypothetical protein